MKNEFITGAVGTALSAVGTSLQINEILQTISLVITIIGGVVSLIIVPLIAWWSRAKKDGKITIDEAEEAAKIINDGVEKIKKDTDNKKDS